jgi:hypothetical protein
MVSGSPTPHLSRHSLVTLAHWPGTLFVLCEWGGEPLYKRGQSYCLKERAASPKTVPVYPKQPVKIKVQGAASAATLLAGKTGKRSQRKPFYKVRGFVVLA